MPTNSSEPSGETQHAIRRSARLPLEIPLLVTSLNAAMPFAMECRTTLVNAHGCGLIAPGPMPRNGAVRLEMVSAKRHATARVQENVPLGGDPETWLIGVELDAPGNFWGIDYAPSDWKIEETLSPAPEPRSDQASATAPKPGPRWRLTDISLGAGYLETATPFPVGTPVLISFRVSGTECLLEGMVLASHPEIGMGVAFTPALDLRARVEDLISRLKSTREVPKILVGRKEERQKSRSHAAKLEPDVEAAPKPSDERNSDLSAAENRHGGAPQNELLDPLLELIRAGPSLAPEQFLNDLCAQRLGKRRDPRVDLALQVLLSGTDIGGRPVDQRVVTVNISRRGALLDGVHGRLRPGDKVSLSRAHRKEPFQVAWVGEDGTPAAGQIGVAAVDPNTTFWSDVLETMVQSRLGTASIRD